LLFPKSFLQYHPFLISLLLPYMCGIIGIARAKDDAVLDIYNGMLMLQHRGQDAAGIVAFDGKRFCERRGNGRVRDVFRQKHIQSLTGRIGLGHVRYPTSGTYLATEAQPFFVNTPLGIYLIHNGNLTNQDELREKVQKKARRHLRTDSDSEILLNVFASQIYDAMKKSPDKSHAEVIFEATRMTMNEVRGAYSVITLIDRVGLFVFRDRAGIRPLALGKRSSISGDEWVVASEDVAIKALDFEFVRDVKPGEAILIGLDGKMQSKICVNGDLHPCIFEHVYLARPDSTLDGVSVYKTQLRLGAALLNQIKAAQLDIDAVIPVPDAARPMALELAKQLELPYREGLMKNRYVGRTFIMPDQKSRQTSIRQKLNPIDLEFRGKNILLVDDSIVRGNTMKRIVEMCRGVGVKNIYVAIGAAPIVNPCVYGVDMSTRRELIAHGLTTEEVRGIIGADALFYQTMENMVEAAHIGNRDIKQFCTGCFDGRYATPEVTEELLQKVEMEGRGARKKITEPSLLTL